MREKQTKKENKRESWKEELGAPSLTVFFVIRSFVLGAVIPGYIWRTVQREGASIFYRGIRTWEKDGSDERTLQILNTWGPLVLGPLWWPIPTRFLEGVPHYNHISSTLIRELCHNQAGVEQLKTLVPLSIASDIVKLYGNKSSQ